jgi:hypothetical protein
MTWRLAWRSLLALGVLSASTPALAGEPTQTWFTLTTPHFYVHYYKSIRHDEQAAARKVARVAERCHAILAPIFKHSPSSRTHIVVTDDTDGANGSAQAIPFNIVRVFLTGPGSRSNLHDYDDWLTGLIMHEYTHILHLDTISGLPKVVNSVMGRIWVPNQLQPRWFIEGLAVYQETRRTAGGRIRGAMFDMALRMHVLQGRFLRLDQITSNTRIYPRGTVPYLYGAHFVRFIADRYGEAALTKISHGYGGTPVPYALNRVAKRVLGKNYEQLYKEFGRYVKRRYTLQKREVERRGKTPYRALTNHGWDVHSPRYSPDGKSIIYIESDGRNNPTFRVIDAKTGRKQRDYPHLGGRTVTFTPDGRHLVHGQGVNWRTYHAYHDLYVQRRSDRKRRRLTFGLRARDPDVSPDGAQVVFVTNELGTNSLRLIPFVGGKPRTLIKGGKGEQFFRPRFSPDGKQVVVSHWRPGGRRDIMLFELASGKRRYLLEDRAIDMDPVFSRDGKRVYFSSDRSGIFNIYCWDLEAKALEQVTNVIGGAFAPAISPDEKTLVYVGYSWRGYDLHALSLDKKRFLRPLPYIDRRPPPSPVPERDGKKPYPVRRYNPLYTIYPRSWSFNFTQDAFGNAFGLEVAGNDVIERHRYILLAQVSLAKGYVSAVGNYAYTRFWPSFSLNLSRLIGRRGGVMLDGIRRDYIEENYGASLSMGLPVLRIPRHTVQISLGYSFNWFRDADRNSPTVLPGMASPRLPEVGTLSGITASVSYSSVQRFAESVSAESGRVLSISLRVDSDVLGSDYRSTQLTWSWTEYIDIPWFDDHVLALRYGGGIARGDFKRRGFFFVGGFPEQDLISAIIEQLPLGGVYLRGYPPGTFYGDQFHLLNVEYRLPLWQLERGLSSLPLYFNFIHLATFMDVGHAFFGDFDLKQLKVGVGGELLLEFVIGYFVPLTLRLGYARGLMSEGGNEFFALIGRRF